MPVKRAVNCSPAWSKWKQWLKTWQHKSPGKQTSTSTWTMTFWMNSSFWENDSRQRLNDGFFVFANEILYLIYHLVKNKNQLSEKNYILGDYLKVCTQFTMRIKPPNNNFFFLKKPRKRKLHVNLCEYFAFIRLRTSPVIWRIKALDQDAFLIQLSPLFDQISLPLSTKN